MIIAFIRRVILLVVWTFTLFGIADAAEPAAAPRWYKGNLHTHTLWSDGNEFPDMVADWYKSRGYHFLALSDHNILSKGEKRVASDEPDKRKNDGALARYLVRFGDKWVETRTVEKKVEDKAEKKGEDKAEKKGEDNAEKKVEEKVEKKQEVRLKTLEEIRPNFEVSGEFLMVQAEEITDRFQSLPIHVNAHNLVELIRPRGGQSVRETIANNLIAVEEQSLRAGRPMLAHVNHPNFGYGVTAEDLAAVIQEKFFEIYNGHPGVNQLGDDTHVSMERMWDIANTIRIAEMKLPPLYGLGTDDSHNYLGPRGASPGRGWVMVRAAELSPAALIKAMQAGDFYASSGVTLRSVKFADGQLSLEIDAQRGVDYVTQFIGTPREYDRSNEPVKNQAGEELQVTRRYSADVGQVFAKVAGANPVYKLTGNELYVRALVISTKPHPNPSYDNQTEQAWTQPVGWKK